MVGKRRRNLAKELELNEGYASHGLIYTDNVSLSASKAFVDNASSSGVTYTDSATFSLPRNAEDPVFYDKLGERATSNQSFAIVLTADRGKGDNGILKAIEAHEKDGNICTIMIAIAGLSGPNIDIALATLPHQQGFKEIHTYAKRFSKIILNKTGKSLMINAHRRGGKPHKVKVIKNVF
jgi:hypothetical protein